jgi:hypothetical protein
LLKFFWLKGDGRKKKTAAIRCLSDKGILDRPARREAASDSYFELRSKYGPADELPYAKLCQLGMALQLEKQCTLPIVELLGPKRKNGMRTLTAYWIGVVIVLAVLNGIRALPAGSRARRSMWNMGIAAAPRGSGHNRAQIGFTKCKLAEHCRRSTNKHFNRRPGRHHASAESID